MKVLIATVALVFSTQHVPMTGIIFHSPSQQILSTYPPTPDSTHTPDYEFIICDKEVNWQKFWSYFHWKFMPNEPFSCVDLTS